MRTFEHFMKSQYQWAEQFDMELLYSQLDMQAAFNTGAESAYPAAVYMERNQLQVENLKLRKALKEVGKLFEVQNDHRE